VESSRGYDARGTLWSPGYARAELEPGESAAFAASTEPWEIFSAVSPEDAAANEQLRRKRLIRLAPACLKQAPANELVIAADQCLITPNTRVVDTARVRASGDDVRT